MRKTTSTAAFAAFATLAAFAAPMDAESGKNRLWYEKPAGDWSSQTLPVGNGRVGGTVWGDPVHDKVTLNEVSLWSGGPNLPGNGSGYDYGPLAGKDQFGSYQPFGNLLVDFEGVGEVGNYRRALDLERGIATVDFDSGAGGVHREVFASHPHDVLVYTAKCPGGMSARIRLAPYHTVSYSVEKDAIVMRGTLANGEVFEGRVWVRAPGGKVVPKGAGGMLEVTYKDNQPQFEEKKVPLLAVKGESFEVYVALATDYKEDYNANWKGEDPAKRNERVFAGVRKTTLDRIRRAHIADNATLMRRMSIDLGKTDEAVAALPTDKRLKRYREGGSDPELEALVYQYGRYVLVAGSRPGNLPLNLQGIWNDMVHAPWACDYHNNINLQMCYWGAEVANLSECHMTFIDFVKAMEGPLHEMTVKAFGADRKGWTTRISQNPWGGGGWVKWNPPVNAWYALHVWDHYLYTQDRAYLEKTAYPILKNICEFWETTLKEVGPEGRGLKTNGGGVDLTSAEHPELKEVKAGSLVSPNGWSHEWGPVEDGCMHDQQLVWELFDDTVKAAKLLGRDAAWANGLLEKRDRLVGNRVAKGGYLQEWIVDRPGMVSGHRHTSHLIGVFPGTTISRAKTPEFAAAAMKSLELRGMSGDNRRSWTWPWRTALWARFGEGERAYEMVRGYLTYNVLDNLFGNHPPMQMDGVYGMTGGMSEMLVQSHAGELELLPALPKAWRDGSVKGIRARGDVTVDMAWRNGALTECTLTTSQRNPRPVTVVYRGERKSVTPKTVR